MKLSEICIERPVFATVLSLLLIIFGWIGYSHLETRYFPKVKEPYAQVSVSYQGASPSLMNNEVTKQLENALINISGLTSIHSRSSYGSTHIDLTFEDGANMTEKMGEIRDEVSSIRDKLPADIDPPSISSGGVLRPVLNIGFMDPQMTQAQIRDYISQEITPILYNLPGMGAVWAYGASTYALRIWLNPQKMAALNVTVTDVQTALTNNNIDFSGGSIRGADRNYSIVSNTRLSSVKQFANMIVKQEGSQFIRLKDIAKVELGSSSLQDSPMRINSQPGIDLEIRPLDTANPITVAQETKDALAKLKTKLPKSMTMLVTYDQSEYLKGAIHESFMTLVEAIILVMLVVFLFLGSIRAALVPIVTIPVCVIAVFGAMLLAGFSINVVTLLAVILAIGLVVDDAIVVLENVHRHIETGLAPYKAALKGSKEIGFAIIAMTITLAAVYAPVGFTSGFSATVFREFAFTLAGAVLISGFVALTLSPMMCARTLPPHENETRFELWLVKAFDLLNAKYRRLLAVLLQRRWWVVVGLFVIGGLGYFVYLSMPQTFIPKEDIGYFTVSVDSPPGSTVKYTNSYMQRLDKIYAKAPDVLSYASFIFSGNATNFVTMKPWNQREQSTQHFLKTLMPKLDNIPGITVSSDIPDPVSYGSGSDGAAVTVHIMSLKGYAALQKTIDRLKATFNQYPGMTNVKTNLKFDNRVFEVQFKRNQAATLGVSPQDIADTMSILMSGKHIGDIQRGNDSYDVLVQMQMKDLRSFSGLNNIYVRGRSSDGASDSAVSATMVPLSNLVTLSSKVRQNNLYRYGQSPSADITADLAPGYDLGTVVNYINQVMATDLHADEQYAYSGRIQAFLKSSGTMLGLFALSILFIYLVLAAQFESFIDPFIILLTVPLCIVAAIATLKVSGGSLNLYTNIGLITLVGLITKHGILITQFANTKLNEGASLIESVIDAAVVRLRPILMTTSAMVLGSIPLALATGPGSNSHQQIGWVIVGGLLFGTVFSLLVVPVAYYLLSPIDHRKKKRLAQKQ